MQLKLISKKPELAENTVSFLFDSLEPLTWKAGQFLRYHIHDSTPDERKEDRFFTIASAPFEKQVRLTTKFVPGDGSTFKKDLQNLKIGDIVGGWPPAGSFTVEDPTSNYVFIAGGIGITPFRSILMELDHDQKPLNVTLLYANRTENAIFKAELEALQAKHPEFKIHYFIGDKRIDEQAIRQTVADLQKPFFYLSGPEPMVQSFEQLLIKMGVPSDHLKRDYFPGYKVY